MSRALDPSFSRSAWTAALVALLSAHCGSTAETPDAQSAADATATPDVPTATDVPAANDVPTATDVPATPDVPVANDVPATPDVPTATDVPAANDVPMMVDVPAVTDVPAANDVPMMVDVPAVTDVPPAVDAGVDSGPPDAPPPPPAQAILGLVRGSAGTHYRVGSGVVTQGGSAMWNECASGFSLIGRDFQPDGFWLCAANSLGNRRFFVGNVVGGTSAFWSFQRGNVTARGASPRDQCTVGSSLLGRSGSTTDGFWVCMDGEMLGSYTQAWEFNVNDDLAGWTTNGDRAVTVRGGRVTYLDPGPDPYMVSSDNRDLDASNTLVYVGLRSGPASTEARLFFVPSTLPARTFSESRSVLARTVPNDAVSREVVFDMSTHPEWRGTLRQLRLDPGTLPGNYEIDYIRVGSASPQRITGTYWPFDNGPDGWTGRGTVSTIPGVLSIAVNINDAGLTSGPLTQSARQTKLRMRLRSRIPETNGEVFFETNTAPGFAQARSVPFEMVPNDTGLREYVADMSTHPQYTGTITRIRIDFGSTSRGSVDIDWIGFAD